MSENGDIRMLVQKLAGTFGTVKVKLMDVTVRTVNKEEKTCIVDSVDGTQDIDGLKVRLSLEICDGNTDYPEEGSTITIAFTDFTEPYMVSATWLTEKDVTVGDQCWNIKDKKQYFNSEKYGGIPIVKDQDNSNAGLLKKINQLEEKYNDLLISINTVIITLAPSGTFPIASFFTTNTSIAPTTQEKDISNPSIFHGKKVETS